MRIVFKVKLLFLCYMYVVTVGKNLIFAQGSIETLSVDFIQVLYSVIINIAWCDRIGLG